MLGPIIAQLRFRKRLLQPTSDNLVGVEGCRDRRFAVAEADAGRDGQGEGLRKAWKTAGYGEVRINSPLTILWAETGIVFGKILPNATELTQP